GGVCHGVRVYIPVVCPSCRSAEGAFLRLIPGLMRKTFCARRISPPPGGNADGCGPTDQQPPPQPLQTAHIMDGDGARCVMPLAEDRKSTLLNYSHVKKSYAV